MRLRIKLWRIHVPPEQYKYQSDVKEIADKKGYLYFEAENESLGFSTGVIYFLREREANKVAEKLGLTEDQVISHSKTLLEIE